ncbi:hypothetical protein F2Q68_00032213 [Brassica cretica]|uniref:Uncharacterized protein n=2 Tax=Brassica cretica TaxID=69181 RepID=A0A8S9GFR1_BRACR|nr:hypothetical protein F2Q68_00032213 [Brassica cretica]KAF3534328.1 hypothetical protein DY000_02042176 [Brassica cretica]
MHAGTGTRGLRPASDCRGYSLVMRTGSRSRVAPSRVTPRSLLFVMRVETIDTNPRHPPRTGFSMILLARASGYSTPRRSKPRWSSSLCSSRRLDAGKRTRVGSTRVVLV